MFVQGFKRAMLLAGALVLMGACNQMDNILPSAGTYEVDALAGQFSLEECSVVAQGESILPYFASPVTGDPDLRSLAVCLEDPEGRVLGRRVSYTMGGDSSVYRQAEAGQSQDEEAAEDAAPVPEKEAVIPVGSFAGKLPPFPLPEDLAAGSYFLAFEIRGENGVLSRMKRPFYYIGDQEFTAGDIRCYLPGVYENSYAAPQGLTVMLETLVSHGEGLEPYIIWYSGKNRIGGGPVSAGAVRLLWTTPLRSGFHSIRAELFPFEPAEGRRGKVKEFSLPVSQKIETAEAGPAEKYLYLYQFAGNLQDTRTGFELEWVQGSEQGGNPLPSWYPGEGIYGLALGEGETYEALRLPLNFLEGGGELCFLIRFLPLENGRIFSARLGSSLDIGFFAEEGFLYLDLKNEEKKFLISGPLPESGRDPAFTRALVTLRFEGSAAGVSLLTAGFTAAADTAPLDEGIFSAEQAVLADGRVPGLTLSLSGELRSWIGAELNLEDKGNPQESPAAIVSVPGARPVLAVDDFAALFRPLTEGAENTENRDGGSAAPLFNTAD
jgi:hypothetical protein